MTFEDFCATNNIAIYYYNFTTHIHGLCFKLDDGYIAAINCKFSDDSQRRTLQHELIHIMENHFSFDASEIEWCEEEVKHILNDFASYVDDTFALTFDDSF